MHMFAQILKGGYTYLQVSLHITLIIFIYAYTQINTSDYTYFHMGKSKCYYDILLCNLLHKFVLVTFYILLITTKTCLCFEHYKLTYKPHTRKCPNFQAQPAKMSSTIV